MTEFAAAAREIGIEERESGRKWGAPTNVTAVPQRKPERQRSNPGNADLVAPALPYRFDPAFDADHFVGSYVAYAAQRTDAALEYHEANALCLLAAATPNLRAHFGPYPGGLPTNLYAILIGDSTTARKSSAQYTARDIHERAIRGSILADESTPEALTQQIAARPRQSSTLYVDELGEYLIKIEQRPYLAGIRGLLLTLYGGGDYRIRRAAKRKGDEKTEDEDVIERPHLTVLGCTTPTVFDRLSEGDVLSGLMPRFAIVWPTSKPARRPFYEISSDVEHQRDELVERLRMLHVWATQGERRVRFDAATLATIDSFAAQLEIDAANANEAAKVMLQRLPPMTLKLAMLSAAGRQDALSGAGLYVTKADAEAALIVAARWHTYALAFAQHVGQSEFERRAARCLKTLDTLGGRIPRREIAKRVHVEARQMNGIEETLVDRGLIQVDIEPAPSGPPTKVWSRVIE